MDFFNFNQRSLNLYLEVEYYKNFLSLDLLTKKVIMKDYDIEMSYINTFNMLPSFQLSIYNFAGIIKSVAVFLEISDLGSYVNGNNKPIVVQLLKKTSTEVTKSKNITTIEKNKADTYTFTLNSLPYDDILSTSEKIPPETKIRQLVKNASGEFADSQIKDLYDSVDDLTLSIEDLDQDIVSDSQRLTIEQRLAYMQAFTTIFSKAKDKLKFGFGYYDYNSSDDKANVYISNRIKTDASILKAESVFSLKDDSRTKIVEYNGDIKRDKNGQLLSRNSSFLNTFTMIPKTELYLGDVIIIDEKPNRVREINWRLSTLKPEFFYEITLESGVNIYEQ